MRPVSGRNVPAAETVGSRGSAPEPLAGGMRAPLVALALLGAAAFLVLRAPAVLLEGRFWAEEGSVYFQAARDDGLRSLLRPHQGYLSLVTNAATGAAALPFVPLPSAPRVTVFASLLVQLVPAFLLLTRRAAWLPSTSVRLAAIGLYLLARPSDEIWLNTANSHFVLAVATAIVLATRGSASRWSSLPVLALSGLSGVGAVLLAPLFWLEAARERTRERLAEAVLLTACALLQGSILLATMAAGGRSVRADADLFPPALLSRSVVAPFVSDGTGSDVALRIYAPLRRGGSPVLPSLAALAGVLALGLACRRMRSREAALLAGSAALLFAAGYFGALGADRAVHLRFVLPGESERYSWAPNVLLLLSLLALGAAPGPPRPFLRAFALALTAVASIHGLSAQAAASRVAPRYYSGPSWAAEVAAWRADPSRRSRIWPVPRTIDLSARSAGADEGLRERP